MLIIHMYVLYMYTYCCISMCVDIPYMYLGPGGIGGREWPITAKSSLRDRILALGARGRSLSLLSLKHWEGV